MLRRTSTAVIWLTSLSMAHATRPSGDLQYFLPQEFLLDLPLREGSFANEVMDMLQSQEFQDVHAEDVDAGILQNVYATSNLNAPDYKAARRICTRVPVGYNKGGDSRMCERPGAIAPRAIINSPTPGVEFSEGNFQLVAEFEMSLKGHLHLWTKTCVMMCWKNQLCDNDVTLTGSFRVTSSVEVIRNPSTGLMGLQPTTKFDFTDGPHSNGCSEDWLLHFFRDVNKDISISVKALVQKWVTETLQPQIKMEQTVQLMPNLTMTYLITRFDFVPDWQDTDGRGYVRIHVNTSIFAVAPNGTVRRFPDGINGWSAGHNALPLNPFWKRTTGEGPSQTVLLGGVRFSQQMLTMIFQGLHHVGLLSPSGSSLVHDARVLSKVIMSQPTVHIEVGGQGALLKEAKLNISLTCPDKRGAATKFYQLLDAAFDGVTQRILISSFVAHDHRAMGLTMQLANVSLTAASMTACHSSSFFGTARQFRAMAQHALRRVTPRINEQLTRSPIVFCGGGNSACSLVPFVPRPEVLTVPPATNRREAGYVQISWSCSCSRTGYYQQCQGFPCPQIAAATGSVTQSIRELGEWHTSQRSGTQPLQANSSTQPLPHGVPDNGSTSGSYQRRLGLALDGALAGSSSQSRETLYLAAFSVAGTTGPSGTGCSFGGAGEVLRFGAVSVSAGCEAAPLGSEDLLGDAYRLERTEDGAFVLHVGCRASSCGEPCLHQSRKVHLHECGAVRAARFGPDHLPMRFMLSIPTPSPAVALDAPQYSPSKCVGGLSHYGSGDMLLLAVASMPSADSTAAFVHAVHLGTSQSGSPTCVPCGLERDMWCSVWHAPEGQVFASLLCDRCSSSASNASCLVSNSGISPVHLQMGSWLKVPGLGDDVASPSGYSQVAVMRSELLPLLRPCSPEPSGQQQFIASTAIACVVCLTVVTLVICWAKALTAACFCHDTSWFGDGWLDRWNSTHGCRRRCTAMLNARIRLVEPEDDLQQRTHTRLWVGAGLLLACGAVWRTQNPLANLLANMTVKLTGAFDDELVNEIVRCSGNIGLTTFLILASLLIALSISMLCGLEYPCDHPLANEQEGTFEVVTERKVSAAGKRRLQPLWTPMQWYPIVAFVMSESTSAVAFLAFSFWRDLHSDFGAWEGSSYTGETSMAIFSIKLLLSWMGPFLLIAHSVPVVVLCSYSYSLAASGKSSSLEHVRSVATASQPFVLASILTHTSIEVILSIVYYRSGYGNITVLYITFAGTCLNIAAFILQTPARLRGGESKWACGDDACGSTVHLSTCKAPLILGALQFAGCLVLTVSLGDAGCWPFLIASFIASGYLAWTATELFIEMTSEARNNIFATDTWERAISFGSPGFDRRSSSSSESGITEQSDSWSPSIGTCSDTADPPPGNRCTGVPAHMPPAFCAWLLERREERDKARYGARIKGRRICLLLGSMSLVVSACKVVRHNITTDAWEDVNMLMEDVAGGGVLITRDHASVFKPLVATYSEVRDQHMLCTILGAALFVVAVALDAFGSGSPKLLRACRLCGFGATVSCLLGVLAGNMPDYAGMLDLSPTLGRCGSEFCIAVASSMRAAFGAASLAQSGATFIPVLVSLPWTLGRIAFFLSADSDNVRAVTALTWGTLTCMLRLSILPATVAFIWRPVSLIAWLYVLFLVAPSLFLLWVVATRRTHLIWYLLWGWVFFMVPLLSMGSVAMKEDIWSLWCRLCQNLLSADNWPNTLAEFALSDVVISDMFFMVL